jgi:hypothetical protein
MADPVSLQTLADLPGQSHARLTFLEETPAERRQLIAALRTRM